VPAQKTVTDLVKCNFTADGPNRLWVTDITEHPTREGKLYCCVVTGVFSRRVVGWPSTARRKRTWPRTPWAWPSTRVGPHRDR
jgi:putative transposase